MSRAWAVMPGAQRWSAGWRRSESATRRLPTAIRSSCPGGCGSGLAIAAALARDPRVLIADEPSTALDVTTQRDILALIKGIQAARGMSLILITHDLRVAFAMCDRIYVLYAGSLVEVGQLGRARR